MVLCFFGRYADRAKQILCKAIVNEDPNAKVTEKISHASRLFLRKFEIPVLMMFFILQVIEFCAYIQLKILSLTKCNLQLRQSLDSSTVL